MDSVMLEPTTQIAPATTVEFRGRRAETEAVLAGLPQASSDVLKQFSFERLLGYGVNYADAVELRAAVIDGDDWFMASVALADAVLDRIEGAPSATRISGLRRASALLRMSQVMMLADTDERRAIFARAAALFQEAATLAGNGKAVLVQTAPGPLAGWLYQAEGEAVGAAIVIGGVEGWAMDFSTVGEALAARGVDALMIDGPGQGESRFTHRHYKTARWQEAYRGVIDYLERRRTGHRIAFVGNSLGGSVAMTIAAADPRIRVCVANGGIVRPTPAAGAATAGAPPAGGSPAGGPSLFFAKMLVASGADDPRVAGAAFSQVDPLTPHHGQDYALLILHGGKDPAVPMSAAETLFTQAPTRDRKMVVFSDGDHCLYNHRDDRDALIADWVRSRLANRDGPAAMETS